MENPNEPSGRIRLISYGLACLLGMAMVYFFPGLNRTGVAPILAGLVAMTGSVIALFLASRFEKRFIASEIEKTRQEVALEIANGRREVAMAFEAATAALAKNRADNERAILSSDPQRRNNRELDSARFNAHHFFALLGDSPAAIVGQALMSSLAPNTTDAEAERLIQQARSAMDSLDSESLAQLRRRFADTEVAPPSESGK